MVLLSILGLSGVNMIVGSFSTTRLITNEHLAYSAARYAMERMSREIREINYDTSLDQVAIASFSPVLTFTKTSLTGVNTTVSIRLSGSELQMNTSGTWRKLMPNVSNLTIEFYDSTNSLLISPTVSNVRSVNIRMTITPAETQSLTLETWVNLRNT